MLDYYVFWVMIIAAFIAYTLIILFKAESHYKISLILFLPTLFALYCTLILYLNYSDSVFFDNKGISAGNAVFQAIIGGKGWTRHIVKAHFQRYMTISISGFLLLALTIVFEHMKCTRKKIMITKNNLQKPMSD